MKKDSSGGLAPVPGYFTSQMLQMGDLVPANEMPFFDIVEYGRVCAAVKTRLTR